MNSNKKVYQLVLCCFVLYFSISVVFEIFKLSWEPFDRINLVSDVFRDKDKKQQDKHSTQKEKDSVLAATKASAAVSKKDFNLYQKPQLITNFVSDNVALPTLMEKLQQLKSGKNVKIRIAYFGDSMIEGDLFTQTLRALLQGEFGGSGVGFLPIKSNVSGFRQTATATASGWNDISFKDKSARNMYFSGHYFTGAGSASYTDNTITNTTIPIEKSIIYGNAVADQISYNGNNILLDGNAMVNRTVLSKDVSHSIKLSSSTSSTRIFGVSFESDSGVFVDNFSFRGITGVELNKLDEDFVRSIQQANHYDLVVFQYGVNLLFRPNDTNYDYYVKSFRPVLEKFNKIYPSSDILIVGSADRAFRYKDGYKTAIGLPNLLESQALLAYENGFSFYNNFATMGGENSIVKWAQENPPLANKDYIHPNHRGAEILGKRLFDAMMEDHKKFEKSRKK